MNEPGKAGLQAIPTEYNGTQYRSRFEANTAALLDAAKLEFEYEPKSFLLKGGVHYQPDFYVPIQRLWIEVRGYNSEKGWAQVTAFVDAIKKGFPQDAKFADYQDDFLLLPPSGVGVLWTKYQARSACVAGIVLCEKCRRHYIGDALHGTETPCPYCDAKAQEDETLLLVSERGNLFLSWARDYILSHNDMPDSFGRGLMSKTAAKFIELLNKMLRLNH